MSINLTMTMGQIISKLESRGLRLYCKGGICSASHPKYFITIATHPKTFKTQRVNDKIDRSALPYSISYHSYVWGIMRCGVVKYAMEMFCAEGLTTPPCRQNTEKHIDANIWSEADHSPDGWAYNATIKIIPSKFCSINIKRLKQIEK